MVPSIIVGSALIKGTVVANDDWRKYGEARRQELLENDKDARYFDINRRCSVHRYFQIGDRVLASFKSLYQSRTNLEEIYLMGHRLIAFYTEALPRHKDYRSIDPSISYLREKSFGDLDWIRKRLDVISLRIDEEQLNLHIQRQKESTLEAATVQQSRSDDADDHETQWESFSGWSADFDSNRESLSATKASIDVNVLHQACTPTRRRRLPLEPEHADDPDDILDLESEDETTDVESDCDSLSDVESDERAVNFDFHQESDYDSSFLRVIANEEVEYEEDSEAVDSWAQDDESLESLAEHAPVAARAIDYSEAEMLGNLLNRVTRDLSLDNETKRVVSEESTDIAYEDEAENVDPSTSTSFSPVRDAAPLTLCSYPSFDEPPDDDEKDKDVTSSPQDVMNFEAHSSCRRSPQENDVDSFSDEEITPIYLPGLRI